MFVLTYSITYIGLVTLQIKKMKSLLKKTARVLLFISVLLLITNCGQTVLVDNFMEVDENNWDVAQKLKTEVVINDTLSSFNFYINVRNTTEYPNSNFFVFIKTTFPDGKVAIDTLECILADYQGKWLGKGNSKLKDSKIMFKKAAIFPMKGKYIFEVEHAMREKVITGIKTIGFAIEQNKKS